jgi:hypothetical protein
VSKINIPVYLSVEFDGAAMKFYADIGQDPLVPLSVRSVKEIVKENLDSYTLFGTGSKRVYQFSKQNRRDLTALAKAFDTAATDIRKALSK